MVDKTRFRLIALVVALTLLPSPKCALVVFHGEKSFLAAGAPSVEAPHCNPPKRLSLCATTPNRTSSLLCFNEPSSDADGGVDGIEFLDSFCEHPDASAKQQLLKV